MGQVVDRMANNSIQRTHYNSVYLVYSAGYFNIYMYLASDFVQGSCMMPSLKQKRKAYCKKYYNEHRANVQNPTLKAEYNRSYYARNAEKLKRAAKTLSKLGGDRKKASSRAAYRADPEKKAAI